MLKLRHSTALIWPVFTAFLISYNIFRALECNSNYVTAMK